ncbi:hypothetical protein BTN50_0244 [Candidatus Enterovibrio altilux]|uniref:Uncharacterized protein n=1 Tax=Candidatus Enterovibrio altilux TaxID=1927128 RepID=A0A291B703_9GAMM|nr:hypothetical protein BTN50_0244 [Candidatus Enterovibrio luxaltus]
MVKCVFSMTLKIWKNSLILFFNLFNCYYALIIHSFASELK